MNCKDKHNLVGEIAQPKEIQGYSAYEIAVIQGFTGTVEEWLRSLHGSKIVSTELIGEDENGGNIYKQTFDNGVTNTFTAPKGEKGDKGEDYKITEADKEEIIAHCRDYITYNGETAEIDEFFNGETEILAPTVSGVWKFNNSISSFDFPDQDVNFVSNFITFVKMKFENNYLVYVVGDVMSELAAEVDAETTLLSFLDDSFSVVDFGTESQEVSEDFYEWFTANAIKQ